MKKLFKMFKTQMLPFVLILAVIVNVINSGLIHPTVVYAAAEEPVVSNAAIATMTVDANVVLGSDNIIINGYNYVTSDLANILNNANITRIPFSSEMAKSMLAGIAAAGSTAITAESLKGLGIALIGAFTKITVILALAGLAYYAYKVLTEDGNSFEVYFLPDSLIINNTHITGFTKPIVTITNYFEDHLKANPNQEVVVPDTGTGDVSKPEESTEGESDHMLGENGTQVSGSKTTGQNGKTERVDVENPAPGKRPGDVHYHEPDNTKWRYDTDSGKLVDPDTGELAPPKVQKVTKEPWFQKAIEKALSILGE